MQFKNLIHIININREWINAGIYSGWCTGLKLERREQFLSMIRKCKSGKIDLILTKSISCFGQSTLIELQTPKDLRALGADVYFGQENLWLHDQQAKILI